MYHGSCTCGDHPKVSNLLETSNQYDLASYDDLLLLFSYIFLLKIKVDRTI